MEGVRVVVASVAAALLALAGCGGRDDAAPASTAASATTLAETTTTTAPEPFTVLVTNDDGVAAPGIDALVEALRLDDTIEVVVVAPASNQSGTGDRTTAEGADASVSSTASGYPAVAVEGFPADAVQHALAVVFAGTRPDLVISGINEGQNLGPVVDLSGTVGAARTAARAGIPALAVSQGRAPDGVEPDYGSGVEHALDWLEENRGRLEPGAFQNMNVPTCPVGEVRGVVEVASATEELLADALAVADCTATLVEPADDVAAFNAGFVTVTEPGLGA